MRKIWVGLGIGAVIVAAVVLANAIPYILNYFEIGPDSGSGDIVGDISDGRPDWSELFNETGGFKNTGGDERYDYEEVFGGKGAVFIKDDLAQASAVDKTTFAQSNKNDDLIGTWNWATGNVPLKDDLSNVYAYATMVPNPGSDPPGPHLIVYAGIERLADEGDSHIEIGFFQGGVGLDKDPPCDADLTAGPADSAPCEFTGEKQDNDLLAVMDFTKGGKLGAFTVYAWDGGSYIELEKIQIGENGEGISASGRACAFNNSGTIGGGGWPSYNRKGQVITELPPQTFTEFGIDISAYLNDTPCLTTVLAMSRSTQSFTSELKDFARGEFSLCKVEVEKSGPELSKIGDLVDYTYSITNSGVGTMHLVSAEDDKVGDLMQAIVDHDGEVLDPGETCTFTIEDFEIPVDAEDPFKNTVTVVYSSKSGNLGVHVTAKDDWSINLFQPGLDLEVTPDTDLTKIGHEIIYTVKITNTSSDDTPDLVLDTFKIDGTDGSTFDPPLPPETCNPLAAGASCEFTFKHTVTAEDPDPLVMKFEAMYKPDGFPNEIKDTASPSVELFQPAVKIEKTGNAISKAGDTVTYTFKVTNESSEDTPALVLDSLSDTLLSGLYEGLTVEKQDELATLDYQEVVTFTADYVVPESAADPAVKEIKNTVTIHYHPGDKFDNDISYSDDHKVLIVHPGLSVTKVCTPATVYVGQPFNVTITITNTGDIALDRLSIADDLMTNGAVDVVNNCQPTLNVGTSCVITYTYPVNALPDPPVVSNTVNVSYQVQGLPNVLDRSASCSVTIRPPDQGCTPGFWKNHTELWDGTGTNEVTISKTFTQFNVVFGVDESKSGLGDGDAGTLLAAINLQGGDLMALNRHAAAALLNAESGIYFSYLPEVVISMYRAAVNGGSIAGTLALFSAANERGCPLGN